MNNELETTEKDALEAKAHIKVSDLKLDEDEDRVYLEVDSESLSEIESELKNILFDIYEEVGKTLGEKKDSTKIKEYIERLKNIQLKYTDSDEIQDLIRDVCEKVHKKIDPINGPEEIEQLIAEIKKLLLELDINLSMSNSKYSLKRVDVNGIVDLYSKLNEAIESKDLKQITAVRGRLIKKLKKENKEIGLAYGNVEPLVRINRMLHGENPSIEVIMEELKKNEVLYQYFGNSLNDLDTFKAKFEVEFGKLEVQRIVFLEGLLRSQLEKHKNLLDERYQKEFLDKKGTIPSIVTVLPSAVSISVKRLANSIEELRQANNNKKKMHLIGDAMKSVLEVVGTPVIYFGKFVASNWYTMYMAYKGINIAKQAKAEQERQAAEEKERAEAARKKAVEDAREREKAAEDLRRMNEEKKQRSREAAEARRQAEEEARRQAEEDARRQVEEEARRQAEEDARRQANESKVTSRDTRRQTSTAVETQLETDVSPKVDPIETIPDEYRYLQDTQLLTLSSGVAYDGNIDKQLDMGLINGDSKVTITCKPTDAHWYEFWRIIKVDIPLRYVQTIWNWSPEADLDNYQSPVQEEVPRGIYYSN